MRWHIQFHHFHLFVCKYCLVWTMHLHFTWHFSAVLSHWDFSYEKFSYFLMESQLQQSCATQPGMHLGYFSVSIIHWSLICRIFSVHTDVNPCDCTHECTDIVRNVQCTNVHEVTGRKSLAALGNQICISGMLIRCSTNWATSPTHRKSSTIENIIFMIYPY